MNLELSHDEADLLADHLEKHIARVDNELVHTDKRQMQRELAAEEAKLVEILGRLRSLKR